MLTQQSSIASIPLDAIVAVKNDLATVELDVRHNSKARVGDQYTARWPDGAITIMRVIGFESAEDYSNSIARRTNAMREGVAGAPETMTARKAYQIKLAIMKVEGELLPDGKRIVGAVRMPDVLVPVQPITDSDLEQFVVNSSGNLILGNLQSGSRILRRAARIAQNYAGERMVILGMPGKGKTQLARALLSQAMSEGTNAEDSSASDNSEYADDPIDDAKDIEGESNE